jgi:hypothetical protein
MKIQLIDAAYRYPEGAKLASDHRSTLLGAKYRGLYRRAENTEASFRTPYTPLGAGTSLSTLGDT